MGFFTKTIYVVTVSHHYESAVDKAFNSEADAKKYVDFLRKQGENDDTFNQADYCEIELE